MEENNPFELEHTIEKDSSEFYKVFKSLLYNNTLPSEDSEWYKHAKMGIYDLVLFAAGAGVLPKEFPYMYTGLFIHPNISGFTPAYFYVARKTLPLSFSHWGLVGPGDNTIAHIAAYSNTLPNDFYKTYPELFIQPNNLGITPAHIYVAFHSLPVEFSNWRVVNIYGNTIAHEAATHNTLPTGFVKKYQDSLFIQRNDQGYTPAHWYVIKNELPLYFPHWRCSGKGGETIAHIAAKHGTLPDGFAKEWYRLWITVNDLGDSVSKLSQMWEMTKHVNLLPIEEVRKFAVRNIDGEVTEYTNVMIDIKSTSVVYGHPKLFTGPFGDYDNFMWYIVKNKIPLDFKYWHLENFAHRAAYHNVLPEKFQQTYPNIFVKPDNNGNTPAHFYVKNNVLPVDFPHWELKNNRDLSIASLALLYNTLPIGDSEAHHALWKSVIES